MDHLKTLRILLGRVGLAAKRINALVEDRTVPADRRLACDTLLAAFAYGLAPIVQRFESRVAVMEATAKNTEPEPLNGMAR
jgi:hypothetical protein